MGLKITPQKGFDNLRNYLAGNKEMDPAAIRRNIGYLDRDKAVELQTTLKAATGNRAEALNTALANLDASERGRLGITAAPSPQPAVDQAAAEPKAEAAPPAADPTAPAPAPTTETITLQELVRNHPKLDTPLANYETYLDQVEALVLPENLQDGNLRKLRTVALSAVIEHLTLTLAGQNRVSRINISANRTQVLALLDRAVFAHKYLLVITTYRELTVEQKEICRKILGATIGDALELITKVMPGQPLADLGLIDDAGREAVLKALTVIGNQDKWFNPAGSGNTGESVTVGQGAEAGQIAETDSKIRAAVLDLRRTLADPAQHIKPPVITSAPAPVPAQETPAAPAQPVETAPAQSAPAPSAVEAKTAETRLQFAISTIHEAAQNVSDVDVRQVIEALRLVLREATMANNQQLGQDLMSLKSLDAFAQLVENIFTAHENLRPRTLVTPAPEPEAEAAAAPVAEPTEPVAERAPRPRTGRADLPATTRPRVRLGRSDRRPAASPRPVKPAVTTPAQVDQEAFFGPVVQKPATAPTTHEFTVAIIEAHFGQIIETATREAAELNRTLEAQQRSLAETVRALAKKRGKFQALSTELEGLVREAQEAAAQSKESEEGKINSRAATDIKAKNVELTKDTARLEAERDRAVAAKNSEQKTARQAARQARDTAIAAVSQKEQTAMQAAETTYNKEITRIDSDYKDMETDYATEIAEEKATAQTTRTAAEKAAEQTANQARTQARATAQTTLRELAQRAKTEPATIAKDYQGQITALRQRIEQEKSAIKDELEANIAALPQAADSVVEPRRAKLISGLLPNKEAAIREAEQAEQTARAVFDQTKTAIREKQQIAQEAAKSRDRMVAEMQRWQLGASAIPEPAKPSGFVG
ncbi:hypothetical protein A2291_03760 [candidate division WOR-1 bacterium RIFOXYB2_FULL_42_35]|uniref:Uncharacterized protein n=1 Tax=candidate division WOR-1 bacterium RIFOXYC2_FULL_41_25 TaxID=1802586 RepID=A0A1F4TR48_UNCSA|nr:MAG: hypothetical protein A2247_00015 [candidate division WOR-1 bacterium RIFOXYA2_FULL_41_14]OGC25578.1 MAG: hypothetical protein A2291_03760 [candidate division WOR-1 bacterium RIFOXYB2_FULL_42_35]OGC35010.1 MAG: hypothetical protein A2462_05390 [candidate division WOR-1 bacterium RIFOXYC2_FULL_41_25]OGC44203.1 MAG: hypothetical protein A2548_02900 [candidate division WOR-1 bacterium RIFOXYD2_FULL_41_8]